MAAQSSALERNSLMVVFSSVQNKGFTAIDAVLELLKGSGLEKWLSCGEFYNPAAVMHFLTNATVTNGNIHYSYGERTVFLNEELFSRFFELPNEDDDTRSLSTDELNSMKLMLSATGSPIPVYGQRSLLQPQFRLLHDLVAKSILAKAGAFNAYTQQRFEIMATMIRGIPINWGNLLYNILTDMVTGKGKQSPGFAVQITHMLDSMAIPISSEFTAAKLITELTVGPFLPAEAETATPRRNRGEASGSQAVQTASKRKRGSKPTGETSTAQQQSASATPPVQRRRRRLSKPELVFEDVITAVPISQQLPDDDIEDEEEEDVPLIRRPRGLPDPKVVQSSTESSDIPAVQTDEFVPFDQPSEAPEATVQPDSPAPVQEVEASPSVQKSPSPVQQPEQSVQPASPPTEAENQNEQMEADAPSVQSNTEEQEIIGSEKAEDDFLSFIDSFFNSSSPNETNDKTVEDTDKTAEEQAQETVHVEPLAETSHVQAADAPVTANPTDAPPNITAETEEESPVAATTETAVAGSSSPWSEEEEEKPVPIEQQTVDLINAEIDERVKEVTDTFDNWMLKRNMVQFRDFPARHFIEQEDFILMLAATEDIATAMKRRTLIADRCREANLNNILKEREDAYRLKEDPELVDLRTNIALEEQLTLLRKKMIEEKKRTDSTSSSSAEIRQPFPIPLQADRLTRDADSKKAQQKAKQLQR